MDLNTVAGQWRSSYEGFVRTPEAVEEVIENYEEETKTRFVVDKKDQLFGSKCDGKLNYRIYTLYVASPIWSQVGYIYFSNSLVIHERISQSEESIWTCARTLKPGKGPTNRIYN